MVGGLWNWIVLAQVRLHPITQNRNPTLVLQVKEGTENRGAIEAVVRVVRKSVSERIVPAGGRGF